MTAHCRVALTRDMETKISPEDFERVTSLKWLAQETSKGRFYAARRVGWRGAYVYLHRFILGVDKGQMVDHINGDTLDNRRENLRICSGAQNMRNRGPKSGRFKGVHRSTRSGRWVAQIKAGGPTKHIGTFDTAEDAARAYDAEAVLLHGEFAWLNFPPPRDIRCKSCTRTHCSCSDSAA